jgi:hypothetical protein
MIVGGEHFIRPNHLFKKSKGYLDNLALNLKKEYELNYTFGGYYSLLAIIENIIPRFDDNSIVLLPSYICPSILKPFRLRGLTYDFYKVDENLYINTDYLISKIDDNVKAVFFIDYFGVSQLDKIITVIEILHRNKVNYSRYCSVFRN